MAIPLVALAASTAVQYAPAVYEKAKKLLRDATKSKVSAAADIVPYVGSNPQRLTVVADSLVRAGVDPNSIFPMDIVQVSPQLMKMRVAALALAQSLKAEFDAGEDKVLPSKAAADAVGDAFRLLRTQVAISVYGSERNYFLCHPTGGIPATDFAYARAMASAFRRA